jgi:hypothetical protein
MCGPTAPIRSNLDVDECGIGVTLDAPIPEYSLFEGSFTNSQSLFTDYQNLMVKVKINAVPVLGCRHHVNDLR